MWQINDDWNALITQSYQNMDSQGVFYQQPNASDGAPLNPLEVTLFNNSFDKDKFESTAWTINGNLGVPQGGLHRRIPGAQCRRRSATTPTTRAALCRLLSVLRTRHRLRREPESTCFSPERRPGSLRDERNTHQQHEFRLEHAGRPAGSRHCRASSGKPTSCTTSPAGTTRTFLRARPTACRHAG